MSIIKLNQKLKRIEIKDFEIQNDIVFSFFDKLPAAQREEQLFKALYIGVLALMEDRLSAFLSKTSNELGTELESLKIIFEMKKELFYKTAIKGILGEEEIAEFLKKFVDEKKLRDNIFLTGNLVGEIPKNKTGDIVCEINQRSEIKIVIECKFDKSIKLGDIKDKDVFTKKMETAWNQLLEAQANRDSRVSIIVFDVSLIDNSIFNKIGDVGFLPGVGFIAIVNSQAGDFKNLAIAYMLARDIAINSKDMDYDSNLLTVIINRIIKDINEVFVIKRLVENNIENNKEILKQMQKSLLLMEFNQVYLKKFLSEGNLDKKDLLDFYMADEIRDKYRLIERELTDL